MTILILNSTKMKSFHRWIIGDLILLFIFNIVTLGQKATSEPWESELNVRQPPERVLNAIGIKSGMTIGEIGVGRGRYTVFIADKVGNTGKVFANDIDETSLAYLRGRCRRLGIDNVETVVGKMDDPLFPDSSIDMAIMVLVYHMIENPDNLLKNLKKSLKPGATLAIIDPHDELIDREFAIDRSKNDLKVPSIKERIEISSKAAGYELLKIETFLTSDYIFILKPIIPVKKISAYNVIKMSLLEKGLDNAIKDFNNIKYDSNQYDISEKTFINLGSEFIGSRSYKEAIAVLNMGLELYPESTGLFGEIGEIYLLSGEKEKARSFYRLFIEHGPDSLNVDTMMQNFDAMYDQMRQQIESQIP
jgi:ubiquinone/menaquinone biosynthesis C-methylase UbiE